MSPSAEADVAFLCSGPDGRVYGPTSLPVDWCEADFQCDRLQCLSANRVVLTLAFCRNAWPRMYSDNSTWKVADAIASQRASVNDVKYFACSMCQPASSFLIGSTMIASLLSERGALLRGFSAGSYSCTAAAIVWKHVLDSEARLHVRIGGYPCPRLPFSGSPVKVVSFHWAASVLRRWSPTPPVLGSTSPSRASALRCFQRASA